MCESKIEQDLNTGLEIMKETFKECELNEIPVMTIFIDKNFIPRAITPAENEKGDDFLERLRGLSKDLNPSIIVGCDPISKKQYDGLIVAVHVESKKNRCFYHKKKNTTYDGWEETFDVN